MADDPFVKIAVDLNEESKASRRRKPSATEALAASREHIDGEGDGKGDKVDDADLADALDGLGSKIEERDGQLDQGGDNGAHHARHECVIMDMESTIAAFEPDTKQLVFNGRDLMLTLLKQQDTLWSQKSKGEQRDVAAAIEQAMHTFVSKTVELSRSAGQPAIRALLESYAEKDGLKASLKIKPFDDAEAEAAVLGLHRAQGKHVLIIVASADDFAQGQSEPDTPGNEPALDFDAGRDGD